MRYLIYFLFPVLLSADPLSESLVNYHLAAGDFVKAEQCAHAVEAKDRTALLKNIERQRILALAVALAGAERALAQSDWATLRREVARALAADPKNKRALVLGQWMADRGIVRRLVVSP